MWIVINSMQSVCAQALRCSTKELQPDLDTWVSTCEQFSTLNGKPTPQASWVRAWKKEAYIQRLFGSAISPNSQQQSFEDWWTASLRASRAKTSAWRASVQASMANALGSSSTSSTLPTVAVRGSSFWRTSQASLLPPPPLWTKPKDLSKSAQPPASWENWPTAGGMRSGSLFQRPTWAPVMGGNGGSVSPGAWMTPNAGDDRGPSPGWEAAAARHAAKGQHKQMLLRDQSTRRMTPSVANSQGNEYTRDRGRAGQERPTLTGQVQHWPTPDTGHERINRSVSVGAADRPTIALAAKRWATPTSSENSNRTTMMAPTHGNGHGLVLAGQAASWSTPRSSDGTKGGPNQAGSKGDLMLPSAAAQWPTPAARDYRSEQGGRAS